MDEKRNEQEDRFKIWLVRVAALLALAFLAVTTIAMFWLISYQKEFLQEITNKHFAAVTGIPLSALSATLLLAMFRATSGNIEFEGLGFKFRGASGPIILWILSFLVFVSCIRLLWGV